jgi:hypothetical protein
VRSLPTHEDAGVLTLTLIEQDPGSAAGGRIGMT